MIDGPLCCACQPGNLACWWQADATSSSLPSRFAEDSAAGVCRYLPPSRANAAVACVMCAHRACSRPDLHVSTAPSHYSAVESACAASSPTPTAMRNLADLPDGGQAAGERHSRPEGRDSQAASLEGAFAGSRETGRVRTRTRTRREHASPGPSCRCATGAQPPGRGSAHETDVTSSASRSAHGIRGA